MRPRFAPIIAVALAVHVMTGAADAQRERTRPRPRGSTAVNQSQASELTLTVTPVAVQQVQVWIRTAGTLGADRRTITAVLSEEDGARVRPGQRARAFSPRSITRMNQGDVASVSRRGAEVAVTIVMPGPAVDASRHFVVEIVTDVGERLAVPNEAILESGGRQVVYVQEADGSYAPREIAIGLRGELYTEVLGGVHQGEQVVTIGSFFIDAEHRLKAF
jgi:Cu(I)/Ag(I) efflux system membrane fusion protein